MRAGCEDRTRDARCGRRRAVDGSASTSCRSACLAQPARGKDDPAKSRLPSPRSTIVPHNHGPVAHGHPPCWHRDGGVIDWPTPMIVTLQPFCSQARRTFCAWLRILCRDGTNRFSRSRQLHGNHCWLSWCIRKRLRSERTTHDQPTRTATRRPVRCDGRHFPRPALIPPARRCRHRGSCDRIQSRLVRVRANQANSGRPNDSSDDSSVQSSPGRRRRSGTSSLKTVPLSFPSWEADTPTSPASTQPSARCSPCCPV